MHPRKHITAGHKTSYVIELYMFAVYILNTYK